MRKTIIDPDSLFLIPLDIWEQAHDVGDKPIIPGDYRKSKRVKLKAKPFERFKPIKGDDNKIQIQESSKPTWFCPFCSKNIKAREKIRHLRRAHNGEYFTEDHGDTYILQRTVTESLEHDTYVGFTVICPVLTCGKQIKTRQFQEHLKHDHSLSLVHEPEIDRDQDSIIFSMRDTRTNTNKPKVTQRGVRTSNSLEGLEGVISSEADREINERQQLIQSDRETLFADKYVGQMRRESSGKFGSISLYDQSDDLDHD